MDRISTRKQKTIRHESTGSYLIGLLLWAFCVQYYVVQVMAALAWKAPKYSLSQNTISDLGNTVCGSYGTNVVCSPYHQVMNISFIVLGICMAGGAIFLYRGLEKSKASQVGLGCIVAAGLGSVLVGLFPENTVSTLHITGAALPFVVGNIGLLFFGFSDTIAKSLRISALVFGSTALFALLLFMTKQFLGIGIGGVERIVAYPQTIWLIAFALYMLKARYLTVYNAH